MRVVLCSWLVPLLNMGTQIIMLFHTFVYKIIATRVNTPKNVTRCPF